jgi:hypothetical protein
MIGAASEIIVTDAERPHKFFSRMPPGRRILRETLTEYHVERPVFSDPRFGLVWSRSELGATCPTGNSSSSTSAIPVQCKLLHRDIRRPAETQRIALPCQSTNPTMEPIPPQHQQGMNRACLNNPELAVRIRQTCPGYLNDTDRDGNPSGAGSIFRRGI